MIVRPLFHLAQKTPAGGAALLLALPLAAEPRFEDHTNTLPEHIYDGGWEHFVGGGVAIFDCNADGLPEIVAAGGENPMLFLLNDGNFSFTPGPFPSITNATGAYPIDLNSDGLSDLFILRVGSNIVLQGHGNCTFSDQTHQWLPLDPNFQAAWSTAFTAWFEPGASRPTLAVGNYVDQSDPNGPFGTCDQNQILRPTDAPQYISTPLTPGFCPLSILAAFDARDQLTLRISNDRHYYITDGHEQMWDITEERFLTEADGWDGPMLWGMGLASRDLTGDGRDEVMMTSMGDQVLQIAQGDGTYAAAPFSLGTAAQRPFTGEDGRPSTGWHAEFADIDNDGDADLFIAKGNVDQMPGMAMEDPNNLLIQNDDGTFTETALAAGIADPDRARGAALADFDGDGRLDLVVVNRRAQMKIARNVTEDTGNWLAISPEQDAGNRFAIGAVVEVRANGSTQRVQRVIGGGHGGGQLVPLHFGVGDADSAEARVRWPNGEWSDWRAVEIGAVTRFSP